MKKGFQITLLFFICTGSRVLQAQNTAPVLLKEPAGWEFERFNLPPAFAPGFPYRGVEELRFSPGMFKKDSADYFTYAFVAQLDNTVSITGNEIKNYILQYYKGLCAATAKDRNLSIDTAAIGVNISRKKGLPANETVYNAEAAILGVFADGAPLKLNMEIKVLNNTASKQIFLVFIASPRKKDDDVWKMLYKIQEDFKVPF